MAQTLLPSGTPRRLAPLPIALAAAVSLLAIGGLALSGKAPPEAAVATVATTPDLAPEPAALAELGAPEAADPMLAAEFAALPPWQGALLAFAPDTAQAPDAEPPAQEAAAETPAAPESQVADTAPAARVVPLPVPRPAELSAPIRRAERPARRVRTTAAPAAPMEDTRTFFEKLLGVERPAAPAPQAPALAYAALEAPPAESETRRLVTPVPAPNPAPAPSAGGGTAVYDITARTVTLPNGEKLEAHSGLGESMDNPNNVHIRMRGSTPPGTYDLTEREALFHGVRAIRLTPVGGPESIHGRAGLLAHTYMLGPNGASNGCISFRDYNRFLQAYLRGEIRQVVVVAGNGGDAVPSFVRKLFGAPERTAQAGN